MRYGNPSIKSKLNNLKDAGCENIIILPLYPQYAAATTATVCDEVYRTLMRMSCLLYTSPSPRDTG